MANPHRKNALKRLAADLEEISRSPVQAVSAAPLDDNMLEWHCNFLFDDTVYHLILFFPDKYPYVSPSAEFVPQGFRFAGGATKHGKKGIQICLSIFSDFADYHSEWATEKSSGWSPGYTVQTVLLNLVSFLAESMGDDDNWAGDIKKDNRKLATNYSCKDCGHTHAKPFPSLDGFDSTSSPSSKKGKGKGKSSKATPAASASSASAAMEEERFQITDYISKTKFKKECKPSAPEEMYGFGLIKDGSDSRPSLTSPCEYLTKGSFTEMDNTMGVVHSIMKAELAYFLPMYISSAHGGAIKDTFEDTMKTLTQVIPSSKRSTVEQMVIKVIPNLMSATVVEFSKGTQHTSENHLNGYFALHRLFLWAIDTYPGLQKTIDDRLQNFIDNEDQRTKRGCHHIGEWLMLLSGSAKYTWQDAAVAYLGESWRRNVMWYVKDDAKLGLLDTPKAYRLQKTLAATAVSRKLLAFQVLFLDIAMPAKMSRADIVKRYDANMGLPTPGMVVEMKEACARIDKMATYNDWFKVLKRPAPSDDEIFSRLTAAVEYSINTDGYKWTFWKNQGGWAQVLRKYPKGTPGWKGHTKAPKAGAEKGEAATKGKGKGKGKAAVQEEAMDTTETSKGKGMGGKRKAEPSPAPKGRGKKVKVEEEEEESEEEMEMVVPVSVKGKGRGRGRGRGVAAAAAAAAVPVVGRGRGRGKRGGRK